MVILNEVALTATVVKFLTVLFPLANEKKATWISPTAIFVAVLPLFKVTLKVVFPWPVVKLILVLGTTMLVTPGATVSTVKLRSTLVGLTNLTPSKHATLQLCSPSANDRVNVKLVSVPFAVLTLLTFNSLSIVILHNIWLLTLLSLTFHTKSGVAVLKFKFNIPAILPDTFVRFGLFGANLSTINVTLTELL